jgi:hypothetical protein
MEWKLAKSFIIFGIILSCTGLAGASTSFNYTGSNIDPSSASIVQTLGGVTATATAFWANVNNSGGTVTGTSTDFGAAWAGEYAGYGMGVCNPNEQPSCSPPQHQIDNYNGLDFVLVGFNTAVNLNSVQVENFGNPSTSNGSGTVAIDMSYAILTQAQETSLLNGSLVFSSVAFTQETSPLGTDSATYNLTGSGKYLLIGTSTAAYYGNGSASTAGVPDAFKIQDLSVSAVPEPASFFLIGTGLMAGAAFGRRHIRKSGK